MESLCILILGKKFKGPKFNLPVVKKSCILVILSSLTFSSMEILFSFRSRVKRHLDSHFVCSIIHNTHWWCSLKNNGPTLPPCQHSFQILKTVVHYFEISFRLLRNDRSNTRSNALLLRDVNFSYMQFTVH